jgi:hypothetical protein
MANQLLYLHWKAVKYGLVPFIIAAFGLPLLAVSRSAPPVDVQVAAVGYQGTYLLEAVSLWLPFFPVLAAVIGATLALTSWSWDHETRHIYALSLPVSRTQYVLHKLGAGATLAFLPTIALLAGSLVASAFVTLPEGLHAYPLALSARFFLSSLVIYVMMFAFAAGTIRTAVTILSVLVGLFVFGGTGIHFVGALTRNDALQNFNFAAWAFDSLFAWPSPFHIFSGNWSLIDV